ncbi:5-hydroxymethyluracil DNA glycosylase [Alkalihalobacillus alcalophilus ATCC 27647 = CGMCC 1.3604]|uniref:Formamidopyrimidine-DNA glycosylase n=1 Tax=Alkalihalobacillus alcalophilus ATCC 27647 = CGMCC 1.3604 TaxID=1218173 RepID=A0A094WJ87_ALKAL|nr:DNA-formamidopyrimidine glycosylase [Alkalihalobacillus alcalophilus]KGA97844.1 5-hydroxymethyluracil DNA glycosylase [Alkalihalobacillus alcalophilus ATCC 27647 = CGMCC 1.3604]MED1563879.1 DNA-formamidopyrimidine glycosylase [Alkalihalobacillus alcalophilus]THG90247.1 5-hydroxymethyluracil DNA glycosylase [Alkalihalobacillus alcalophilus ATCC 27647 = CGMCC 1.3604]
MPELPEVETVKRTLTELVVGKTIKEVEVLWPKIIKKPDDAKIFQEMLQGQTIAGINRRGKFLIFQLDDYALVSHLRMEGRYGLHQKGEERTKHTHVIFHFEDGTELWYQDVRKFGTMHLFLKGEEETATPLLGLGVEPFSEQFQQNILRLAFEKTQRKVKVVLLDQKAVVGLGNIYVDEALFRSGIHPERLASSITDEEIIILHQKIRETLQEAVDMGGSSVKSYVNGQGDMGMFQQRLDVYGRKSLPCNVCGTEILKTVVGGRGTHFCPSCQK